jgi:hypothetical protein
MNQDQGVRKLYRQDNQPFAQVPNDAIRDPEITAPAFRLLAYLMSHQDGYELTYAQIERQTGMGRYAINEGIKNLERKGWLRTESTKGTDGRFGPKSWTVLNPTTVGNSTAGDSTAEKPTDNKNTTYKEDKELRSINQDKLDRAFSEFWEVYPRKVGKSAAKKSFAKAYTCANGEVVLGAQRYANDPYLPLDKNFIPHPATWLNAGRWEDDPLPPRERSKEELIAIDAERRRRNREADLKATEELLRANAEAARNSAPPPKCEHGDTIVSCKLCLRKQVG